MANELSHIDLLVLDVDGVLTDGGVTLDKDGEEIKTFHVWDGLRLRMLQRVGIPVAIITGRKSKALSYRVKELGITLFWDAVTDKAKALAELSQKTGIGFEKMAAIGDDLPDLPMFSRVGFSVAVQNAHPIIKEKADLVLVQVGGKGAVCDFCESLLQAKGLWEKALEPFTV